MRLNPNCREFVPVSKGGHEIPGESKPLLAKHKIFGQPWNECLKPPLSSEYRRLPPVSDLGPLPLGEHIGPPLLSDRSFRELNERGDLMTLLVYHREFIEPSCISQYRLPNEIEFPESSQRVEALGTKSGDTGCLSSWDGVDSGEYGRDNDGQYRQEPADGASSSRYNQHGDDQYQLNQLMGPVLDMTGRTNSQDRQATAGPSEHGNRRPRRNTAYEAQPVPPDAAQDSKDKKLR